jgi:hypothetical protein
VDRVQVYEEELVDTGGQADVCFFVEPDSPTKVNTNHDDVIVFRHQWVRTSSIPPFGTIDSSALETFER